MTYEQKMEERHAEIRDGLEMIREEIAEEIGEFEIVDVKGKNLIIKSTDFGEFYEVGIDSMTNQIDIAEAWDYEESE